jgi:hypothetical protein
MARPVRERFDIVLDPRHRGTDPEQTARAALERLLRSVTVPLRSTLVDIMDPYGVPTRMLRRVAELLPRGSSIRIISGDASFDADFPTVALSTGVSVARYTPPLEIPLHDRFLRVGNYLWSLGASLNHLGHDFSAILEVRDPVTVGEIASALDACLAGTPNQRSPRSRTWCEVIRDWWHRVSS